VAVRVADCARAERFYSGLLGLDVVSRREDGAAVWLRAGDAIVMLETALRGTGPKTGSGHVLALEVNDLPAWERRLGEAGVAIVDRTPHTLFVSDPDGHRVGLSTFPRPW
jgi:catechol 2,3-dioxygenase-like lactoylglutathione lyase family enzyme